MSTQKVAIVTDSSAYIPPSELENLDITIIPLWLIWEGESLQDGVDIDPPRFYERLKTAKKLATTSQPTPMEFMRLFETLTPNYDAIVNVLVSSKISGTYNSAVMAHEKMPQHNITVIDSQSSSMGLGFQVLAAAKAAAAGKTVSEIVQAAEDIRSKMNFLFVVDTLEYLHRSGRIKASKRVLGTLLKVKPILHFLEGSIQSLTSERTMKKATERMLQVTAERLGGKQMTIAAVVDINAPERGDLVAELIQQRFAPQKILRSDVSPVVGNVVGPGAYGVAFYAAE